MNYARAIQMGLPVGEDAVPLFDTDCVFGRWYHGEGQKFRGIPSFDAIDGLHARLHDIYLQIYKSNKSEVKGGLFVSKAAALKKKEERCNRLMTQLREVSEKLLKQLDTFERDLRDINEWELTS